VVNGVMLLVVVVFCFEVEALDLAEEGGGVPAFHTGAEFQLFIPATLRRV
jgi:hypothetical protein